MSLSITSFSTAKTFSLVLSPNSNVKRPDHTGTCFCIAFENKNYIKKKLSDSQGEFYKIYDLFYNKIHAAAIPASTWLPLISKEKYYALSNDFSCMISTSDFEELFLDGLIDETLFYDKSIYHLDGPGALRHLDTILSMKNLNAVQWVPGAGHDNFKDWIDVYKKIQKAGKGIDLHCISVKSICLLIIFHLKVFS